MFIVISVYWKIGDCFLYLMMRGLIYSISCWINHILYCVLVFCSFFVFKSLFCQDKKSLSSERKLVISYLGVLHQATLFSLNYKSFCSIIAIWSVVFFYFFYQLSHNFHEQRLSGRKSVSSSAFLPLNIGLSCNGVWWWYSFSWKWKWLLSWEIICEVELSFLFITQKTWYCI